MNSILFSYIITFGLMGLCSQSDLKCPSEYQSLLCKRTKQVRKGYENMEQINAMQFLFCHSQNSPRFTLLSEKPMHPELQNYLIGLSDEMFNRNGFGAFTDKRKRIIATLTPLTATSWHLILNKANNPNSIPFASSIFNCH